MPKKVLIVDDEVDVATSLKQLLELSGYYCEVAATAAEARTKFDQSFFDVVLMDYVLPKKTGLQLASEMKKKKPFTRIIMLSGLVDNDKYPQAQLEKDLLDIAICDRYLMKPVSKDQLVGVLTELLRDLDDKSKDWESRAKDELRVRAADARPLDDKIKNNLKGKPGEKP